MASGSGAVVLARLTDESRKGRIIALQLHKGFVMEIQFKDIKIKEMN